MKKLTFWVFLFCIFTSFTFSPLLSYAALFEGMTVNEEIEMGKKFDIIMKTQAPVVYDPYVRNYLKNLMDVLVAQAPSQPFKFEANMLIDPTLNAFAYPGGFVFINTGLFLKLENESELAGIMAHEGAHVTQRHIAGRQGKSTAVMIGSLLAAAAAIFLGNGSSTTTESVLVGSLAAGQAALLQYSRADETSADNVGYEYMIKAGYNPEGYVTAFKKLQAQNFSASDYPSYLSTHPDLNIRISGMESRIRTQTDLRSRKVDSSNFYDVQTFVRAYFDTTENAKHAFTAMDQNAPMTQLAWGILYSRLNNIAAASEAFDKALKLAPNNTLILREAGRFQFLYGDSQKAFSYLNQALQQDRTDFMARFFLAKTQDELGQYAQAQSNYLTILKEFPYDSEVHGNLGRSYGKSQNLFDGYLHLAYAALYQVQWDKADSYQKQAQAQAKTGAQKKQLEAFNLAYSEYKKALQQ